MIIDHGAHPAVENAADKGIPDLERPLLDQDGRNRPSATIQLGLNDGPAGQLRWVRLKLEDICLEQNHFQ